MKTWEHTTDLEQYRIVASRYWAGDLVQVGGENAKDRRYRVQLAKHTLASAKDERHVATGYHIKFAVIPVEGQEYIIVTSSDRTYISK